MTLLFRSQGLAETALAWVHSHSTPVWRRGGLPARRLRTLRAWPCSKHRLHTCRLSCSSTWQAADRRHSTQQGTIVATQQYSGALPVTDSRRRRLATAPAAAAAGVGVEGAPPDGMVPGEPGQQQALSRRSPQRGSGGGSGRSGLLVAQHLLAEKLRDEAKVGATGASTQ